MSEATGSYDLECTPRHVLTHLHRTVRRRAVRGRPGRQGQRLHTNHTGREDRRQGQPWRSTWHPGPRHEETRRGARRARNSARRPFTSRPNVDPQNGRRKGRSACRQPRRGPWNRSARYAHGRRGTRRDQKGSGFIRYEAALAVSVRPPIDALRGARADRPGGWRGRRF